VLSPVHDRGQWLVVGIRSLMLWGLQPASVVSARKSREAHPASLLHHLSHTVCLCMCVCGSDSVRSALLKRRCSIRLYMVHLCVCALCSVSAVLIHASSGSVVATGSVPVLSSLGQQFVSYCFARSGVALATGHRYFTIVVAENRCGLNATAASDGFLFDTTPPILTALYDGDGRLCGDRLDWDLQSSRSLSATWMAPRDPDSGVSLQTVTFFGCGAPDLVLAQRTMLGNATNVTIDQWQVQPVGSRVCVSVTATDGAGNSATVVSNGTQLAYVAPTAATVRFGALNNDTLRRVWNVSVGVAGSYSGVDPGAFAAISTLEWAVFQCPVSFWVSSTLPASAVLPTVQQSCTPLTREVDLSLRAT
jgi:hypothetical protein